jgi:hypothetical protein
LNGEVAGGAQVEATLVLGRGQRLTATVQAHTSKAQSGAEAAAWRQLGA